MRRLMLALAVPVLSAFCQEVPKTAEPSDAASYTFVQESKAKSDPLLNASAAFLEKNNVIFLATYDGQSPRVRPLRYTAFIDNKLAIATSVKKELSLQMAKDPHVEVSAVSVDGSSFFRYKGKAVVCADAGFKAKFLAGHPKYQKLYGENFALYLIEPEMVGLFPLKGGQAKTKTYAP